jgi:hypothetical protein
VSSIKFFTDCPINPSLFLLLNLNKGPIAASRGACHRSECLDGGVDQEMLNWCHISILKWDSDLESRVAMVCVVAPSTIGHPLEQYEIIKHFAGFSAPPDAMSNRPQLMMASCRAERASMVVSVFDCIQVLEVCIINKRQVGEL